jgi:hypothetical protein
MRFDLNRGGIIFGKIVYWSAHIEQRVNARGQFPQAFLSLGSARRASRVGDSDIPRKLGLPFKIQPQT